MTQAPQASYLFPKAALLTGILVYISHSHSFHLASNNLFGLHFNVMKVTKGPKKPNKLWHLSLFHLCIHMLFRDTYQV